jgi:UDP:flavonoid glycosyltransferase YjiC (YdhE family)
VRELAAAVQRLLDDPSYGAAARRVADEIAGLAPVSAAVPLLQAIAGSTDEDGRRMTAPSTPRPGAPRS